MNADKLSVKMHAVEMILPKPGDVFLKEWTKSDKKQNCDAFEEIYAIVKKCWQACLIYKVLGASLLTQTENISFPSFFPQSNSPYLSFEWSFYGIFAKQ